MRAVINNIFLSLIIISVASCRHSLGMADYLQYINNPAQGYTKRVELEGWEFAMQYRPYDYIMLMENKGNWKDYDAARRKAMLAGTAWFTITLRRLDNGITPLRYGISSIEEYNSRLNYYLNEANKDIKLIYGADTLYPMSYAFENNYNLAPQETMVVGFYLPVGEAYPRRDMQLSLTDRIFKNGIIKVHYPEQLLKNTPNLSY